MPLPEDKLVERNAKRDIVWTSLENERMYVQSMSDLLPQEQGAAIITGAGMHVGLFGGRDKKVEHA